MKYYLILLTAIILIGESCKVAATTRIFVVRHADRTPAPADDLIPAGVIRADELKRVLLNAGVDSIFSTNFVRTKKTVQPLANAKNLQIILYPNTQSLLNRILTNSKGKTVLVAGHSDNVPEIITQCGCTPPFNEIPDSQFDNLFLIIIQKEKINGTVSSSCKLIRMRYGAITN
ncbi:MAG TPA: histidine phosphatase family protein [Ferruginibacter sp.]|nr:histidine phosphatase family protein [Bacteroidota bacterium]MCC6692011.1 histidine phosphatase family protein [Chitinophagaceae bacterium]HMT96788.1 histidine phosphatase family protein [Ferruginibacter sp.]HMU24662.1 histidine phosphatase family protein [Ferruginibacter sp.]